MPDVNALLADGLGKFSAGDVDGAIALVEQALALQPQNARALTYLAYLSGTRRLSVANISELVGRGAPTSATAPVAPEVRAPAPQAAPTLVMAAVGEPAAASRPAAPTGDWFENTSVVTDTGRKPVQVDAGRRTDASLSAVVNELAVGTTRAPTPPPQAAVATDPWGEPATSTGVPSAAAAASTADPWAGNSVPPRGNAPSVNNAAPPSPPASTSAPTAGANTPAEDDKSWSGEVRLYEDANADGLNKVWTAPQAAPAETPRPESPWDDGPVSGSTVDLDHAAPAQRAGRTSTQGRVPIVTAAAPARPAAPASVEEQCATLLARVKERHDLGDFSGSLEFVEKVLALDPVNPEARDYLERNAETLQMMYASKLGNLERVPALSMTPEQVIWLNLHHKAGFVLSRVDGMSTYEDIISMSAMPRLDTMRILVQLADAGVIKAG